MNTVGKRKRKRKGRSKMKGNEGAVLDVREGRTLGSRMPAGRRRGARIRRWRTTSNRRTERISAMLELR